MKNNLKIQASTVKKLKPPEKGDDRYWDTELKGFMLRIYPSGSIVYYFRYYNYKGREVYKRIGNGLVPAEARRVAKKLQGMVAMGVDPAEEEKENKKQSITFQELVDKYLEEELPKISKKNQGSYRKHLTSICDKHGRHQVRDLKEEDFLKIQQDYKNNKGLRTSNVVITLLKRLFNLAQGTWKLVETNPCQHIKKFKEIPRTERLDLDQIERLNASIDQELDPYVRAFYKLLLRTACRLGELQNMKWQDVNFSTGEWKKPTTKIGEPHIIPLGDESIEILQGLERKEDNPYVFCGKAQGKPLNGFRKFWLRITMRAGIEGVTTHDMRRTVGWLLLNNDVGMERVSKLLGHKSIRTTERVYAGLDMKEKRKTINALESIIKS